MKRLDKLGVTPAPWEVFDDYDVRRSDTGLVADCGLSGDARLIAAAPDLYESLREAVISRCGGRCAWSNGWECRFPDELCEVQRWRKALEKAGGAE